MAAGWRQNTEGGERGDMVRELAEARAQTEALKERLLLAYADMENLRERSRREVESAKLFAVQGFAKGLADVADNLTRAAASVQPAGAAEGAGAEAAAAARDSDKLLQSLLDGVVMVEKQLLQVFEQHGMRRYNPLGDAFDPNLHNAMFELADRGKQAGTIAHVLKVGYTLHGRVVRPADVGVVRPQD
eukprot:TRINITY_DN6141_c0_g1_i1.p3 TRINITY_DN6141_c0_g1~~TRINITY_DN6141_c0_g1_i1.p3  ORF type:complete len:188 (+),score=16.34 TRINITY_DN6141_c0_g1_i1:453-1016(+)